jgi:hypothetical protein
MNRTLSLLLALVLVAAGAAYAASPFYAFHQLKEAALAGDRDQLNALVDFPGVREDLKRQVDSRAVKVAREASGIGYPIAAILGHLGAAFGDHAIDKLVTPEAISGMVRSGMVPHKHKQPADEASAPAPAADDSKVATRFAYLTPDRFRVAVSPADQADHAINLIMDRRGLFSWRLEQIELPGK